MRLTDISYAKQIMAQHGIATQKRFGQNFLTNPRVVDDIADICADDDCGIIEIGPGIGTLTEALADRYYKVVAIEIDRGLIPVLADTLSRFDNVTVINADVMKIDFAGLISEHFAGHRVAVCANLPYYITSPIIMKLLECGHIFESLTVMVQKEVADRLTARAGSDDYGAITLAVDYRADVEKCFDVSPGNFLPPPKVTSTVIRLTLLDEPRVKCTDPVRMFAIIRAAFGQRRKTLVNALSSLYRKEAVLDALNAMSLDAAVRGERLSIGQYAELTDILLASEVK